MTDRRKETLARLKAQLGPEKEALIREVLGVRSVRVVPVKDLDKQNEGDKSDAVPGL